jgi:hypothetical protein
LWAGTITAVLFALAGCAAVPTRFACPAIGYINTASIELADPAPGLRLELCSGASCTPGLVEAPVEIGATSTPPATGVFELTGNSESGWTATLLDAPADIAFRVTDTTGNSGGEGVVHVDWKRVDGNDRCGGNQEADVIIAR